MKTHGVYLFINFPTDLNTTVACVNHVTRRPTEAAWCLLAMVLAHSEII